MTDERIFISDRRADADAHAVWLAEALVARFGRERVFFDLISIPAGADFEASLDRHVRSAAAVVIVIGSEWLDIRDAKTGQRRLDDPQDWVRWEVETALKVGRPILPVLLEEAETPSPDALPESLRPLSGRKAVRLQMSGGLRDPEALAAALQRMGV